MSKKTGRALRWVAVAVWAMAIFAVSAMPGSRLPGGYSFQAHFIEYGILGALLFSALAVDRRAVVALVLAVAIASAYGVTDEYHQSFVPLRQPDPIDWLTDTAGALAGASVAALVHQTMRRRRERQMALKQNQT